MNAKAAIPGANASACPPRRDPRGSDGKTHSRRPAFSPALPFRLAPLVPKASGARPFVLLSCCPFVDRPGWRAVFPEARRNDNRTSRPAGMGGGFP